MLEEPVIAIGRCDALELDRLVQVGFEFNGELDLVKCRISLPSDRVVALYQLRFIREDDTDRATGKSIDAAIRADSGDFRAAIDDAQRIEQLARKLSRERIKTTTLDLIDIAKYAEQDAPRERDRKKELSHEL